MRRSRPLRAAPPVLPRAASTSPASASRPPSAAASTITPVSSSSCTTRSRARSARWWLAAAMTGCLLGWAAPAPLPRLALRCGSSGSPARRAAERIMNAPLVIAVPAKGRLQANMEAFFARVGLELVKPRGVRDYRGTIANLPGVEVAYLSAAEVVDLLAQGAVHLGVTGEDLVREKIPDADRRVVFVDALGFGHANVAVRLPQAWFDVHSMADLDDVAIAFRLKHERKMRVATKYVNLTRDFFSSHGVTDYRIVESSGATEAAPAAGTAELIVDITTTGATLAA